MKNTLFAAFIIVLAVIFPSFGNASFYTGNELLAECRSSDANKRNFCRSYIIGISDGIEAIFLLNDKRDYCSPSGVSAGQIRDIVVQYMTNNPRNRHFYAATNVYLSLIIAFPCGRERR